MSELKRLRTAARREAESQGHRLGNMQLYELTVGDDKIVSTALCKHCNQVCYVYTSGKIDFVKR